MKLCIEISNEMVVFEKIANEVYKPLWMSPKEAKKNLLRLGFLTKRDVVRTLETGDVYIEEGNLKIGTMYYDTKNPSTHIFYSEIDSSYYIEFGEVSPDLRIYPTVSHTESEGFSKERFLSTEEIQYFKSLLRVSPNSVKRYVCKYHKKGSDTLYYKVNFEKLGGHNEWFWRKDSIISSTSDDTGLSILRNRE